MNVRNKQQRKMSPEIEGIASLPNEGRSSVDSIYCAYVPMSCNCCDKGCVVQLYWPDDGTWYSVAINAVNVKKRMATCVYSLSPPVATFQRMFTFPLISLCRIQYDTGEIEELDLTEVINDEQMYLLD